MGPQRLPDLAGNGSFLSRRTSDLVCGAALPVSGGAVWRARSEDWRARSVVDPECRRSGVTRCRPGRIEAGEPKRFAPPAGATGARRGEGSGVCALPAARSIALAGEVPVRLRAGRQRCRIDRQFGTSAEHGRDWCRRVEIDEAQNRELGPCARRSGDAFAGRS